jgi:hypothetical protein
MTSKSIDFVEYVPINRKLWPAQARQYCRSLPPLTPLQEEIIVGIMLGDGSMKTRGRAAGPQTQIRFEQQVSSREYVEQVYMKFVDFVGKPPQHRVSTKSTGSYVFRTYHRDCLRYYANAFYYQNNQQEWHRAVPKNIHKMLTARSLAYWFMDDGSWARSGLLYLNTQSFTRDGDQERLIKALDKNCGIKATRQRDGKYYRLYILRESHDQFYELVHPYIYSCFVYKLAFYRERNGI